MNAKPPLDTVDYEAIEAAVMETPRGRWFLSEFLRRHQAKETERLLAAIARLERALEREAAVSPRVRAILMGTAASICQHVSNSPPALPVVAEAMATEARSLAEALSSLARAADGGERQEKKEAEREDIPALAELARRQWDLAAQMETLARGIAEMAALVDADAPVPGPEPAIPADALQWFAAHDDLFDSAEGEEPESDERHPETAPAAAAEKPKTASLEATEPGETSAPDSAGDEGETREGHLTVLIRPRQTPAGKAKTAKDKADDASCKDGQNDDRPSASSATSARQTRIIIRHKSSSDEVAIPFLEGTDGKDG